MFVYVTVSNVIEVNEGEVGNEQVEEVFGESMIETQEGRTQYMMALIEDDRDTMQGVGDGGGSYQLGV